VPVSVPVCSTCLCTPSPVAVALYILRLPLAQIDMEHYEWEVLPDIFESIATGTMRGRVGQMQVELHNQEYFWETHWHKNVPSEDKRAQMVRRCWRACAFSHSCASDSPTPRLLHCDVQIQTVFEKADAARMLLFAKDPNTVKCAGYSCGEWSWVSADTALRSFIASHCPSQSARLSEFLQIPLPGPSQFRAKLSP
jgi:hypothetical protein